MEKEKKERLDVMLDMETLGTTAGSIILSVAMRTFTLDGSAPKEDFDFHHHISVLDSLWHHLQSDERTEEWWRQQGEGVRVKAMEGQKTAVGLESVMRLLHAQLKQWNEKYDLFIWGRGVGGFDLPLLDSVMKRVMGEAGYKTPWNYWAAMDVRSIVNFCKQCGLEMEKMETPHDAREDVMKQIKEVQTCWNYVKVEKAI